jgi:hypothetical protein
VFCFIFLNYCYISLHSKVIYLYIFFLGYELRLNIFFQAIYTPEYIFFSGYLYTYIIFIFFRLFIRLNIFFQAIFSYFIMSYQIISISYQIISICTSDYITRGVSRSDTHPQTNGGGGYYRLVHGVLYMANWAL